MDSFNCEVLAFRHNCGDQVVGMSEHESRELDQSVFLSFEWPDDHSNETASWVIHFSGKGGKVLAVFPDCQASGHCFLYLATGERMGGIWMPWKRELPGRLFMLEMIAGGSHRDKQQYAVITEAGGDDTQTICRLLTTEVTPTAWGWPAGPFYGGRICGSRKEFADAIKSIFPLFTVCPLVVESI